MKERIIGAVVLVFAVVLVVPVFLDGRPDSNETVSTVVPLPGQTEQETQTIVLDRDRRNPVPAASGNGRESSATRAPSANETAATPLPAPPEPSQDPAAEARPTTSATGMWAVQLGSFGDQQNAERLAAELRAQGFAAFLSKLAVASGDLHRVRIGPQKDREAAEAVAARLAEAGHKGQVVPHP